VKKWNGSCLTQCVQARTAAFGLLVVFSLGTSGCYRYAFELGREPTGGPTVTYVSHPATFLNGFVGTGSVDALAYCPDPIRTELKVSFTDVLVSVASLLVYTPHTLKVVCPGPRDAAHR
jgi:hypothetical protein